MKLNCFETVELSDIGRKRKNNEDACLRIPEKGVYCVADGMGGVVGGDLASAAIIDRMRKVFIEEPAAGPESFASHVALFRQAANAASRWIKEFAEEKVIGQMGSTLVAIVFDPDNPRRAVGLHAGDSRLYRYRKGQLQLLTADHTAAAALAALAAKMGRDPAQIPDRFHNELAKAVGLAETVELEKTLVDVASGDVFLLCSDGLTRMLPEEAISAALKSNNKAPLDQAAKALISGANEAGGKDNVTVVLIRMGDLSGFSKDFEPVDLDEARALEPHAGLESDTLSLTRLGSGQTRDSSEPLQGHTPQTEEAASVHGDTPHDDHSTQMQGDTPQTADSPGPPTPATTRPTSSPGNANEKKASPVIEGKRVPRKSRLIGAALVVMAIAGAFFYYRAGRSAKSNGGDQPPRSSAPAPVISPLASTKPSSAPANNPIPANKETPPPPPLTGGVVIQSEPTGAEVFFKGRQVGVTPYHADGLRAGQVVYELETMTHTGKVVLSVIGGQTTSTNVTLTALSGTVTINSDPPGAEVWLGNQDKGKTPVQLELPAGQAKVILKANGLSDRTATVMVAPSKASETNVIFAYGAMVIQSEPAGADVAQNGKVIGHTPYTAKMVPPGQYNLQLAANGWQSTNVLVEVSDHQTRQAPFTLQKVKEVLQPPKRWTNKFPGLVFVKVGPGVWAAINRVTLKQFKMVMAGVPNEATEGEDSGQQYVVNITSAMATNFAAKLTQAETNREGRPDEIKGYHYALPTTNLWMQTFTNADRLGIQMNLKTDKEWCLDGNSWHIAGYVRQGGEFNSAPGFLPLDPGEKARRIAIRLVLVP